MKLMNSSRNIEISLIVPVYNSEDSLIEISSRIENVLNRLVGSSYEVIFVNDGSNDSSWYVMESLSQANSNIIAINLTRNFGQHNATMCGFVHAKGKFVITIDDDLQVPPEEIPKLFNKIQEGFDIVYGIYKTKQHSFFRNFGSELVQYIYRRIFNSNIQITSFRVIKREIVELILSYDKGFTFIDGLLAWFTHNIGNTYVSHNQRKTGKSGYSLWKLLILALNMVTNFSIIPVQIASMVGLFFATSGFIYGIYTIIKKLFFSIPVTGFATIIVAITIFAGIQLCMIGLLGEYISRIHLNINNRPQYAIRDISKKK